jgi:hypothetical protein
MRGPTETEMRKPMTISIPHSLGREEAKRRLQSGLAKVRTEFGERMKFVEEAWTEDKLDFRVTALGQSVDGFLDVRDDAVLVEVNLPWVLAMVAQKAETLIRSRGALLLGKR